MDLRQIRCPRLSPPAAILMVIGGYVVVLVVEYFMAGCINGIAEPAANRGYAKILAVCRVAKIEPLRLVSVQKVNGVCSSRHGHSFQGLFGFETRSLTGNDSRY